MLKYFNYDIVFQEVPDEVTLAINLTQCPNHCRGCHSPHLQKNIGKELTEGELDKLCSYYSSDITCVCFMGGDGEVAAVEELAEHVRNLYALKVAWYSGRNVFPPRVNVFNFIKLGEYLPEKGALNNENTNQRFYKIINGEKIDITHFFWK